MLLETALGALGLLVFPEQLTHSKDGIDALGG
jgi:hypothetical protein